MSDHLNFNNEAEQGLIGEMLAAPQLIIEIKSEYPNIEEFFFDLRHRAIFEAMLQTNSGDLAVLLPHFRGNKQLESVGGAPYLVGLANKAAGIGIAAQQYAELLRDDFVKRRIRQVSVEINDLASSEPDASGALEEAEKRIMRIGSEIQSDSDLDTVALMDLVMEEMDQAMINKGSIQGLKTGFRDFDRMTNGVRGGQVIVIAARPGAGKTSLAMNIAEQVAVENKEAVGVFSLEMTATELMHRMVCSRARIDSQRARDGNLAERDKPRLLTAINQIRKAPIHICEKSGLTIAQLGARARRMVSRHKIKLLIIDYLQLMTSRLKENGNARITEISNGVKILAKDLKIPVILLSQLNRDCEKENRKPRLSDLRESGSIEQDADLVMLLAPQELKKGDTYQKVEALIPKHRGGPVGKIDLLFHRELTRFESASPVGDVPTEPATPATPTDDRPENWYDDK